MHKKPQYPNEKAITKYLLEAKKNNPGPWDQHSLYVGQAAKLIAHRCQDLDEDLAYAMGALHDIGRREGLSHMHHTIAGYEYMKSEGFDEIAKICLSHSFPNKEIEEYFGHKDLSDDEMTFMENYLNKTEYDDYDLLIQLCDIIGASHGFVLMEKRMIDVALRYGTSPHTDKKWKKSFAIKEYFEKKIGMSIYDLLPNVKENTFV